MVIGPTGVFIIEAKIWDDKSFKQKLPHKEADKAGLVVYIKLNNVLGKYIPIYNIVTSEKQKSYDRYGRVRQLYVWQLSNFIKNMEKCISNSEIRKIKRLL